MPDPELEFVVVDEDGLVRFGFGGAAKTAVHALDREMREIILVRTISITFYRGLSKVPIPAGLLLTVSRGNIRQESVHSHHDPASPEYHRVPFSVLPWKCCVIVKSPLQKTCMPVFRTHLGPWPSYRKLSIQPKNYIIFCNF